jgi:hypothetical protein
MVGDKPQADNHGNDDKAVVGGDIQTTGENNHRSRVTTHAFHLRCRRLSN